MRNNCSHFKTHKDPVSLVKSVTPDEATAQKPGTMFAFCMRASVCMCSIYTHTHTKAVIIGGKLTPKAKKLRYLARFLFKVAATK